MKASFRLEPPPLLGNFKTGGRWSYLLVCFFFGRLDAANDDR